MKAGNGLNVRSSCEIQCPGHGAERFLLGWGDGCKKGQILNIYFICRVAYINNFKFILKTKLGIIPFFKITFVHNDNTCIRLSCINLCVVFEFTYCHHQIYH